MQNITCKQLCNASRVWPTSSFPRQYEMNVFPVCFQTWPFLSLSLSLSLCPSRSLIYFWSSPFSQAIVGTGKTMKTLLKHVEAFGPKMIKVAGWVVAVKTLIKTSSNVLLCETPNLSLDHEKDKERRESFTEHVLYNMQKLTLYDSYFLSGCS